MDQDNWWNNLTAYPYVPSQYANETDISAGSVQVLFLAIAVAVSIEQAFRCPIRTKSLRWSLRAYQGITMLTMLQGTLCIFQVFTGIDDYMIWMINAMCYGYSLASSYLFFFYKHKAIFGSEARSIFADDVVKKAKVLEYAFFGQFLGYIAFVSCFPLIDCVGYIEGGPRVQYTFPMYQSVLIIVGDTGISTVCLLLFATPLLYLQKSKEIRVTGKPPQNNYMQEMLWRNAKCAAGATLSTAIFMISSFFLSGPWWISWGCFDLMINIVLCRLMFKFKSKATVHTTQVPPTKDCTENFQLLSVVNVNQAKQLFESNQPSS